MIFKGITFIIGVLVTYFAFTLLEKTDKCSSKAQKSARGLLVLGAVLMTMSLTLLVGKCDRQISMENDEHYVFVSLFVFLVSVAVITLASIVHSECKNARGSTTVIISIGAVMAFISASYVSYKVYLANKSPSLVQAPRMINRGDQGGLELRPMQNLRNLPERRGINFNPMMSKF